MTRQPGRDQREPVAPVRVLVAVPEEEPDQERDQRRHVDHRVVPGREVGEPVVGQHEVLEGQLATAGAASPGTTRSRARARSRRSSTRCGSIRASRHTAYSDAISANSRASGSSVPGAGRGGTGAAPSQHREAGPAAALGGLVPGRPRHRRSLARPGPGVVTGLAGYDVAMPLRNGDHGYGVVTKSLHWVTVLAVAAQFVVGYTMEVDDSGHGRGRGRGEESGHGRGRGEATTTCSTGSFDLVDLHVAARPDASSPSGAARVLWRATTAAAAVGRAAHRRATGGSCTRPRWPCWRCWSSYR